LPSVFSVATIFSSVLLSLTMSVFLLSFASLLLLVWLFNFTVNPRTDEDDSVAVDRCGSTSRLRMALQALRSYPHPLERVASKLRLLSPEPSRVRLVDNEAAPLRKLPTDRQPQRTDSQCFEHEDPGGLLRLIRRCQPVV